VDSTQTLVVQPAEVVLHVDDEDCRPARIDVERRSSYFG
jgi:hypothetical protein